MKNPYTILGVSQDVERAEIMKAQMLAMKDKRIFIARNCRLLQNSFLTQQKG
jgi:hypothetical protein